MRSNPSNWTAAALAAIVPVWLLAVPASAQQAAPAPASQPAVGGACGGGAGAQRRLGGRSAAVIKVGAGRAAEAAAGRVVAAVAAVRIRAVAAARHLAAQARMPVEIRAAARTVVEARRAEADTACRAAAAIAASRAARAQTAATPAPGQAAADRSTPNQHAGGRDGNGRAVPRDGSTVSGSSAGTSAGTGVRNGSPAMSRLTRVRVMDIHRSAPRFRAARCLPRREAEAASTFLATTLLWLLRSVGLRVRIRLRLWRVLRRLLRSVVRRLPHLSAIQLHVERRRIPQAEDQAARGRGLRRRLLRRHRRRLRRDLPEAAHRFRCPSDRGPRAGLRDPRVRRAHHAGTHDDIFGRAEEDSVNAKC